MKTSIYFKLTLLALTTIIKSYSQNTNDYSNEKNKYNEIINYANLRLEKNIKDNLKILKGRAETYYLAGEIQKSLNDYNLYLQYKKNDHEVLYNRSIINSELGNLKLALKDINYALKLNNKNYDYTLMKGYIFEDLNKIDSALKYYLIANKIDSISIESYICIGSVLNKLNKFNEAIRYLDKGIKKDQNNVSKAHINRGFAKANLGRFNEALEDFNIYYKKFPQSDIPLIYLAFLYQKMGEITKACDFKNKIKDKRYFSSPTLKKVICP